MTRLKGFLLKVRPGPRPLATERERAELYEAIGRAVVGFSRLEHVAIELALVGVEPSDHTHYGATLANVYTELLARHGLDEEVTSVLRGALSDATEMAALRNGIVHGVWGPNPLDDDRRFHAPRTVRMARRNLEPSLPRMGGVFMSATELREFAGKCDEKTRALAALRDRLHARRRDGND